MLFLTVLVLGATGLSDKMLNSMLNEELRGVRQHLITQIKDSEQLNKALEAIKHELIIAYGLDKPWYARLPNMMLRIIMLDLGAAKNIQSFTGSKEIAVIILERLPNTILLVTTAIVINFLIGLFIGARVATKPGTILDRFVSLYSAISYAIPTWWLGLINILIFAFFLKLFPYSGMFSAPPPNDPLLRFLDLLWHVTLPLLTLIIALSGSWIYVTRSLTITTAQEDFVNVARAKGLPEPLVQRRYILRVVAPSILTNVILGLAGSIAGAILTETVFGWPGMGQLYYQAIFSLDEALILALTYVFTLVYVIARFILEILYVIVDPRVRY
ncbi:MAG: ABC transporter permease [Candidatus Micrarchaeia archaeon]